MKLGSTASALECVWRTAFSFKHTNPIKAAIVSTKEEPRYQETAYQLHGDVLLLPAAQHQTHLLVI